VVISIIMCGTLYSQRTEVVFEGHLDMEVLTLASCNLVVFLWDTLILVLPNKPSSLYMKSCKVGVRYTA
jgi:hypothetical protein